MPEHAFMLGVRNILLVNLVAVVLAPEATLRLRSQLVAKWKSLKARIAVTLSNSRKNKFWEIDMTKFEP